MEGAVEDKRGGMCGKVDGSKRVRERKGGRKEGEKRILVERERE